MINFPCFEHCSLFVTDYKHFNQPRLYEGKPYPWNWICYGIINANANNVPTATALEKLVLALFTFFPSNFINRKLKRFSRRAMELYAAESL
jgi:hypothetical protein